MLLRQIAFFLFFGERLKGDIQHMLVNMSL